MAVKKYYHDIDLVRVGALLNFRIQNITEYDRIQLGLELGSNNIGLPVYDTDGKRIYIWDGAEWKVINYSLSEGVKSSAIDSGNIFDMSITDDYMFICVKTGSAGNAIWKKVVLFGTN